MPIGAADLLDARAHEAGEFEERHAGRDGERGERVTERVGWLRLVKLAIRQQPYCSIPGCTGTDLTGDHRLPVSKGGTSTLENVQVLCRRHNSAKRDR